VIRVLSDENVHVDIISGLRQEGIDLVTAMEAGLCGQKDLRVLEYAEEHDLLILSGDKDFGGLIEFGNLWGKGRVLLLRYQVLDCVKIVKDIVHVLLGERETLEVGGAFVIVLSERGYRVRRPSL